MTAFDITQWSLEGKNTVSGLGEHTGPALASATAKFNGTDHLVSLTVQMTDDTVACRSAPTLSQT